LPEDHRAKVFRKNIRQERAQRRTALSLPVFSDAATIAALKNPQDNQEHCNW